MMFRLFTIGLIFIGLSSTLWHLWSSPYLPAFHDQYQAERVFEMSRALAFGQLPPRYVEYLGYGYGYPLFNFYGPLPYYIGSFFYLLGIDLVIATKLMITVGSILAWIAMFYCAKRLWGTKGGILSATLYTFAPYHAVQLYVRGSIGELYAYAFLPLVVMGCVEIFQKIPSRKRIALSILGTTLLYLSHTVSLYMTALVLTIFIFISTGIKISQSKKRNISDYHLPFTIYLLPLLLSAYFWIPALTELSATKLNTSTGNNVDFMQHFLSLGQLWNSSWGYGGSTTGTTADGMSFMIGKAALILVSLCCICLIYSLQRRLKLSHTLTNTTAVMLALIAIFIFFTNSTSQFIWTSIPMFQLIQFPWRWLMFIALTTSLLAGSIVHYHALLPKPLIKQSPILWLTALSVLIFQLIFSPNLAIKFFRPESYYAKNATEITEISHLVGEVSAVSDEYLYKNIQPPTDLTVPERAVTCTMPCRIIDELSTPTSAIVIFEASRGGQINIPKANFPGFKATLNNRPVKIAEQQGQLGVSVSDAGTYTVRFELHDTPIRIFANMVSLTSVLVCAVVIVKKWLKANRQKPIAKSHV